jgi:hypothetical protein
MDRLDRREFVRVLLRVRPSLQINTSAQLNESTVEESVRPCICVIDDRTVKITPVQVEQLRYGLSKLLEVHSSSYDKLDKFYKFDKVFGDDSVQEDVFSFVSDTISQVLDGYTTSLLSYGPAFGGKSFTMVGTEKDPGIIPRAIVLLFQILEEKKASIEDGVVMEVEVSYVELHNNIFRNLLKNDTQVLPPFAPRAGNIVPTAPKAGIFLSTKAASLTTNEAAAVDLHDSELNPAAFGDRIDLHENPALGLFLAGNGLRMPVQSAEETFNLLRRGESNRLSISIDGSTRFFQ